MQAIGIVNDGRWEERPTRSQVARMLYRYHQHITERTAGANHQHTAGGLPADDTNTTTTAAGSQAVTTTTAAAVGGSGSEVRLLLVELEYEGPSEPNIWPPQIFTITRMPPRSFWGDDGIVIVDQPYLAASVTNAASAGGGVPLYLHATLRSETRFTPRGTVSTARTPRGIPVLPPFPAKCGSGMTGSC